MVPIRLLLGICILHISAGLLCYQCQTAGKEGPCISEYKEFINTAKKFLDPNSTAKNKDGVMTDDYIPYYKNCSAFPNRTMCLIEEVRGAISGEIMSYIRDCSDGVTFNFDLPVLRDLSPSNHSTCAYDARGFQVCITLCDMVDFCNGPQYTPDTSGTVRSRYAPYTVVCLGTLLYALVSLLQI